jgi:hypothetical protein
MDLLDVDIKFKNFKKGVDPRLWTAWGGWDQSITPSAVEEKLSMIFNRDDKTSEETVFASKEVEKRGRIRRKRTKKEKWEEEGVLPQ